jgi:hypothetical protein
MGYETRIVLAVDTAHYEDIHWGEHKDYLESTYIEEDRIIYVFDWSKRATAAMDYFMEEIAIKDEGGHIELETFGAISLGEDDTDIEYLGEPWEFGIHLSRDIEYR